MLLLGVSLYLHVSPMLRPSSLVLRFSSFFPRPSHLPIAHLPPPSPLSPQVTVLQAQNASRPDTIAKCQCEISVGGETRSTSVKKSIDGSLNWQGSAPLLFGASGKVFGTLAGGQEHSVRIRIFKRPGTKHCLVRGDARGETGGKGAGGMDGRQRARSMGIHSIHLCVLYVCVYGEGG